MSFIRRSARAFLGLALLAAVALVVAFVVVLSTATVDERQPADAIVVLGAAQYNGRPSPVLQARLDHALTALSRPARAKGDADRWRGAR